MDIHTIALASVAFIDNQVAILQDAELRGKITRAEFMRAVIDLRGEQNRLSKRVGRGQKKYNQAC